MQQSLAVAGPLDPLSPAACRTELGTYEYLAAVHGQVACRRCPVAKLDQFRLAGAVYPLPRLGKPATLY